MLQSTPTLLTQSATACLPSRHDHRLHNHRVTSGQAEAAAERRLKELGVQLDEAISEKGQIEQEARSSSEEAAEQLRQVKVGGARVSQAVVLLVLGLAIVVLSRSASPGLPCLCIISLFFSCILHHLNPFSTAPTFLQFTLHIIMHPLFVLFLLFCSFLEAEFSALL